jgi:hypothetical protein
VALRLHPVEPRMTQLLEIRSSVPNGGTNVLEKSRAVFVVYDVLDPQGVALS